MSDEVITDEQLVDECLRRGWGVVTLGSGPRHVVTPPERGLVVERQSHIDEINARVKELEASIAALTEDYGDLLIAKGEAESRLAAATALYRASDAESHAKALAEDVTRLKAEAKGYEAQRDEALIECERVGTEATKYQLLLEAAENERDEPQQELAEAENRIEELRAELRRYEPSDGVMYTLLDRQTLIDDAVKLLEMFRVIGGQGPILTGIDAWLERAKRRPALTSPLREPDATILALHSVIDEARELFDKAWGPRPGDEIVPDLWAAIDEWRNRVLVKEARETVSKHLADMAEACKADAETMEQIITEYEAALERIKVLEEDRATKQGVNDGMPVGTVQSDDADQK